MNTEITKQIITAVENDSSAVCSNRSKRTSELESILRLEGYSVVNDEEGIHIKVDNTQGFDLKIDLDVMDRWIGCSVNLPFKFSRGAAKELCPHINRMNCTSKAGGHTGFWVLEENGIISLYAPFYDNGRIDDMKLVLMYLIDDLSYLTNKGLEFFSSDIPAYAPSDCEYGEMYR